jgi:hypothetical protein
MRDGTVGARNSRLVGGLVIGAALWSSPAFADPPAGAPPVAPADATAATPSVPIPPPAPATAPPVAAPVEAPAKPPTATETMAATRPDVLPPIDVGAWTRVGSKFQNGTDPSKMNDWHMDSALIELHAGGKIHKNVGVTLNLVSNMQSLFNLPGSDKKEGGSYVAVEDAIVSFDFMDEIHLWAGHLLVTVDRANSSGPFFMIPWNYPGFFTAQPNGTGISAPHEGPSGRNNGAVVWGDIGAAKLTYFVGVYDDANVAVSPLLSGRLRLSLLEQETGFWGNGSYFGDKDILTIDLGGQFQKNGSGTPAVAADPTAMPPVLAAAAVDKDYAEINVGVLFEKKLGGGSFVTGEGAYYHYNVLDNNISDTFYIVGAYATPTMGVGSIQPMARYQWEKVKGPNGTKPWNVDVGVAYLIKGPALRVNATFSHTDLTNTFAAGTVTSANSIQLGAQAIFF